MGVPSFHPQPSNTSMTKQKQPTRSVPFRSEIRASGAGETWSHTDDGNAKFQQFGWRCTNDEKTYNAAYVPDTVAEQGQSRLDMKKRILGLEEKGIDRSFPAHQPELYIVPKQEMITTSQLAYGIGTKSTKSKSNC